jgi:hypothetical protein
MFHIFHPFGIFLGISFFLFVFFVIGGLFRFGAWRHWAAHNGPEGWRHGHGPHWDRPAEGEKSEPTKSNE